MLYTVPKGLPYKYGIKNNNKYCKNNYRLIGYRIIFENGILVNLGLIYIPDNSLAPS
jgi:hypothetical protein